ncbi:MAG: hypothetical protein AVDCRST_MAG19-3583, partial [uncultured Thermomicrobiales bacterium]
GDAPAAQGLRRYRPGRGAHPPARQPAPAPQDLTRHPPGGVRLCRHRCRSAPGSRRGRDVVGRSLPRIRPCGRHGGRRRARWQASRARV